MMQFRNENISTQNLKVNLFRKWETLKLLIPYLRSRWFSLKFKKEIEYIFKA